MCIFFSSVAVYSSPLRWVAVELHATVKVDAAIKGKATAAAADDDDATMS